jgi:hypothetical protein
MQTSVSSEHRSRLYGGSSSSPLAWSGKDSIRACKGGVTVGWSNAAIRGTMQSPREQNQYRARDVSPTVGRSVGQEERMRIRAEAETIRRKTESCMGHSAVLASSGKRHSDDRFTRATARCQLNHRLLHCCGRRRRAPL